MKRIVALLCLCALTLSFVACGKTEVREITCEEIVKVYEDAGYTVEHHNHCENATDADVWCSMLIEDPENPRRNYLYIDRYSTADGAKDADKKTAYNPVTWFLFGIHGEWRWLRSKSYGDIHYHGFEREMMRPLHSITK